MLIIDSLLKNPQIRMKNPELVQAKLQKINNDGYEKLMVISDFDYTLTRYKDVDGNRCLSSFCVIDERIRETNPEIVNKRYELVKKYVPIEFCPIMSKEEKIPHMEDFWRLTHECYIDAKFTYNDIEKFVSNAPMYLRDFAIEFMQYVETQGVPLILFSAGIGNVIDILLEKSLGHIPETLHLISNYMNFDANNICVSFSQPVIHTFCKNASVISGYRPFLNQIKNRTNVFLLGDSLGDIHMDVGMEKEAVALKIGYLNADFDKLIEKYLDSYDIVLVDCQSMKVPLEIFRFCGLSHHPPVSSAANLEFPQENKEIV